MPFLTAFAPAITAAVAPALAATMEADFAIFPAVTAFLRPRFSVALADLESVAIGFPLRLRGLRFPREN
jgi:hypothetical protein